MRLLLLAVIVTACLAAAGLPGALVAAGAQVLDEGEVAVHRFHISDLRGSPILDGHSVAWVDAQSNIHVLDVDTRSDLIVPDAHPDRFSQVALGDGLVVWSSDQTGVFNLYAYELVTQRTFPVHPSDFPQGSPQIQGNVMAWVETQPGPTLELDQLTVHVLDLATNAETVLSTERLHGSPRLAGTGRYLCYWATAHGTVVLDRWTGTTQAVHPSLAPLDFADGLVLYTEPGPDLYAYDLATDTSFLVAHYAYFGGPAHVIARPWIVYSSVFPAGSKPRGLYAFDEDTGQSIAIDSPAAPAISSDPYYIALSGNLVVWRDADGLEGAYLGDPSGSPADSP